MNELLSPADVDSIDAILAATYGRADYRRTIVVDGYGVRISVDRNHLTVSDGIGAHRRLRTLTRSQRAVRRIVVLGEAGTLSLAAIRWCIDTGITLVNLTSDGTVLAQTVGDNPHEARLRRAQAVATLSDVGLETACYLIREKVLGHAANLTNMFAENGRAVAEDLRGHASDISNVTDIAGLREVEARAAAAYFALWQRNVAAQFATRDARGVPAHWVTGNARASRLRRAGRSPRKATDPVNAILNYAYSLAEIECRIACVAVGLDPELGIMHADVKYRASMALDLLEAIRPIVESDALQLLQHRRFRAIDFIETKDGTCRLTESVTHPLTERMDTWAKAIAPVAETVAHMIGAASPTKVRVRTPLTRSNHRTVQAIHAIPSSPQIPDSGGTSAPFKATCIDCGQELPSGRQKRCSNCEAVDKIKRMTQRAENGAKSRRESTDDPTQSPESRATRIASQRASRAARDAWDATHANESFDRKSFAREIVPALAPVPLSRIVQATGVSIAAASKIRRGILAPHPRHWAALTRLTEEAITVEKVGVKASEAAG